jgi:hypothetical protein
VTSKDLIKILSKPIAPYLGHLVVSSRFRKEMEDNEIIFVPVQDNKKIGA